MAGVWNEMISMVSSSPRHSRILCFYDLSDWPQPRDIQILPPSLDPGQHQTLMRRSTQKGNILSGWTSPSGFQFLVEKELLYSQGFRITSHHRWPQQHWHWSFLVTTSVTVTKALCPSSRVFAQIIEKSWLVMALPTPAEDQAQAPTDLTMPI